MDEGHVRGWFEEYLFVFAATGRGERQPADVVGFYSAPLLLTSDDLVVWLRTTEEVASWLQTQVDGMLAAKYDRSETLSSETAQLNHNTAMHRATFSRQRADGEEINRLTVTYVVTHGTDGFHISVLVLHAPRCLQVSDQRQIRASRPTAVLVAAASLCAVRRRPAGGRVHCCDGWLSGGV